MFVPVFSQGVCVFDYEHHDCFEGKDQVDAVIHSLFELPEVTTQANVPDAKGGRALSTAHLCETLVIPELLSFKTNPLGQWILQQLLQSAHMLGFHHYRNVRKMKYHRTWVNRMGIGCDAVAHRHAGHEWVIPHMVAIYYTDVPPNSADIIFIDDDNLDVMRGDSCDTYSNSKQHKITSQSGRLIVHDARFFHGTSVHHNELTRTCIVLEVGFAPL